MFMGYFCQCRNPPDIQIYLTLLVEQSTSRVRFSRVPSMIGISSIQIVVIFANPCWNLSELLKENLNDSNGIKLLTRLWLNFSHMCDPKFRHNFKDVLNPFCICSIETETTLPFFLLCYFCNENRAILVNDLENINQSLPTLSEKKSCRLTMTW